MKVSKKIVLFTGACILALAAFAGIGPRAVKAAVATLVQVANTDQTPAITRETLPQLLTNQTISLFGNAVSAPVDVSTMHQIRVNVSWADSCSAGQSGSVFLIPPTGQPILLDQIPDFCNFGFSKTYDMPGGRVYVIGFGFGGEMTVQIYGR